MVPLSEVGGLLEWVQHTGGMRPKLQAGYIASGVYAHMSNKKIQAMYEAFTVRPLPPLVTQAASGACSGR